MAKKKDAPALLGQPGLFQREPGYFSQYFFYITLILLGLWGTFACFLTVFTVPFSMPFVVGVGICSTLLCVGMFLGKPVVRWVLSLSLLLGWGLVLWANFDTFWLGCRHIINEVITQYALKLNMVLPIFLLPETELQEISYQCTVALALIVFPVAWCLSWLLVQCKSALGAFCVTGVFLLIPLTISLIPDMWAVAILLVFWVALLLLFPSLGQRHKLVGDGRRYRASGLTVARPLALLLLPLIFGCMAILYTISPAETYQRPKIAQDIFTGLSNGFGISSMLDGGVGNSNGGVSLSTLGRRNYTGRTVLRVKYDWQDSPTSRWTQNYSKDYLKSFVGSVYTGSRWERLPEGLSAEAQAILGDFSAQNLPSLFSQYLSSDYQQSYYANLDSTNRYTLSVRNTGANPRMAYVPYGLSTTEDELPPLSLEGVGDGFVQSANWLMGTPEYSVDSVGLGVQGVSYVTRIDYFSTMRMYRRLMQEAAQGDADTFDRDALDSVYAQWEGYWNDLMQDYDDYIMDSIARDGISYDDLWKLPDWVREDLSAETLRFIDAIEAYNEFVYEQYTQLPEETEEFLLEYRSEHGLLTQDNGVIPSTFSSYVSEIRLLFEDFEYTLSPSAPGPGEDFVEYFLSQSQEGYCVHFATAAVALLRSAGIPARYAEGYAVPSGDNGRWKNIPDRNAHAWVEIYYGGTGWLPVEVTPASEDAPATYIDAQVPDEAALADDDADEESSQAAEESSSQESSLSSAAESSSLSSSTQEETENAESAGIGWLLPWALGIPAAALLLALVLIINRRVRLNARRKRFAQRDRNKAALAIYAHLVALQAQYKRFLSPHSSLPPDLTRLAEKAKFSNHNLTPEELKPLLSAVEHLEDSLMKNLSAPDRLRCKYLMVLF